MRLKKYGNVEQKQRAVLIRATGQQIKDRPTCSLVLLTKPAAYHPQLLFISFITILLYYPLKIQIIILLVLTDSLTYFYPSLSYRDTAII
jgi:hypothetical protein